MRLLLSLFIFAAFWPSAHSLAQGYPSRLVRVIQPLGVGSPGDLVSRAIAQSLSQTLGQPVVVENRVGANGIIGMEGCAKAAPDGYTICVPSFSQVTMNPVIYSKLPYDPLRDLAPVINIGVINSSIVVNASVPVNTLRELFALAKTKPGALNWGSWGVGSFPHLYLAWMQHSTGTSFTHVPYKTIALAVGAVVAGEVQVLLNTPGLVAPQVKAGKVKVLAVIGRKRSPLLDAPTLEEAGFELPITSWVGVTAPAGTPKDIVQRLNAEIAALLADPKFVERVLAPMSVDPIGGSPEEFAAFLRKDREIAEKVAKLARLKTE
ncbi:MAG: tripartite tricarboxylate transporter substrate binding protein [Betaproteobacteria bacterium]|nr:tripartite tricarboxylate transporter substrate binding protein [Betaproteobacteria bacterium]